jgi:hypothetical protein
MKRLMTHEQFLNEAHIYFDDHLLDTLIDIEKDNPIAKRLLDLHKKQQDTDIAFAMQGKKGKVNIITYKKAAETLRKKEDDVFINDVADDVEADKPLEDDWQIKSFNFLRDNKAMTATKISRLVNTLFPKEYEDAEGQKTLRDLIDKYGALTDDTMKFEVVKGDDIKKWYLMDNYETTKGDLGGSCMRHDRCQTYFDIYTKNPEVVSLLICLGAKGTLIGRALIWNLADSNDPSQLMDRIYFRDERVKEKFISYAEDNDMAYKSGRGLTNIVWRGERFKKSPKVKLDEWEFDEYPYMDTFAKLDIEDGTLYNSEDKADGFYILTSTDGGYHEREIVWSTYEDQEIDEEEAVWCEPIQDWISRENSVYVSTDYSRTTGDYPKDHPDIVHIPNEGYFHIDDTQWSDCMDRAILYSDAIEIVGRIDDMEADSFGYEIDYVDRSKKLVIWRDMLCANWLRHLIDNDIWDEKPFLDDDVVKAENGKYYLVDWSIVAYETEKGPLSFKHCQALGIDNNGLKETMTDTPSYYWGLKPVIKNELIDKLREKDPKELQKIESWKH